MPCFIGWPGWSSREKTRVYCQEDNNLRCRGCRVGQPGCFTGGSCCCPGRGTDRLAGRKIVLAMAALFVACSPKSNSACGIEKALEDVRTKMWTVPIHLRDSSYRALKRWDTDRVCIPMIIREHGQYSSICPVNLKALSTIPQKTRAGKPILKRCWINCSESIDKYLPHWYAISINFSVK